MLTQAPAATSTRSVLAATPASLPIGSATLVRDIDTSGSSNPQHLTAFHGGVAFSARDDGHGRELWLTRDGTAKRLGDIAPGTASSSPDELTLIGDTLFFTANDPGHGRELWRTDGTGTGTRRVKDIRPGAQGPNQHISPPSRARSSSRPATGSMAGSCGGATARQRVRKMVKDIQAHGSSLYSSGFDLPDQWAVLDGHLYFGVQFDNLGLWRTDGTRAGTKRVYAGVYPQAMVATSARLFFHGIIQGCAADDVLFASDGTSAGTRMVSGAYQADPVVAFKGRGYFVMGASGPGRRLYRSSGTWDASGPVLPKVKVDAGTHIQSIGGSLFLSQDGGLSISDGYGVHTYKLGDTDSGFVGIVDLAKLNGLWYFPGGFGDHGSDLWQTDGTPDGTTMVASVDADGAHDLRSLVHSGSSIWFTADDSIHGRELWRYVP